MNHNLRQDPSISREDLADLEEQRGEESNPTRLRQE